VIVFGLLLGVPAAAGASVPSLYEGAVNCEEQSANGNVQLCSGTTTTWDGKTKIDVSVEIPPESAGDGPFPVIGEFHGWGGEKIGLNSQTQGLAEEGYVVFSMSDRVGATPAAPRIPTNWSNRSVRPANSATTT
jgi:hypothetical protein